MRRVDRETNAVIQKAQFEEKYQVTFRHFQNMLRVPRWSVRNNQTKQECEAFHSAIKRPSLEGGFEKISLKFIIQFDP